MTSMTNKTFFVSSPAAVVPLEGQTVAPPLSLGSRPWRVFPASSKANRTVNPIREIVDPIVGSIQSGKQRGDGKDHISLALGDPTAAGNLSSCPVGPKAVEQVLQSPHPAAGYVNALGLDEARHAVARYHSSEHQTVSFDDVIIANGCSGALELVLTSLLDTDLILLVPRPGFPLYQVICESHGAQTVSYPLDGNWNMDLSQLSELVAIHGDRIAGIVVNNPGNPTGTCFSRRHLQDIVSFCSSTGIPIIADEVYGDLVYGDNEFCPMADVAAELGREVPVITVSGIGKQFLLPGWRVGWAIFQDNVRKSLAQVKRGAQSLAQVILGASHLAQCAVPALLDASSPEVAEWKSKIHALLEDQANYLCSVLSETDCGLGLTAPSGAMYALARIDFERFDDSISSDADFSAKLLVEENVFVLPGSCFGLDSVCRLVFCVPKPMLAEAASRIIHFCRKHHVQRVDY